MDSKSKLIESEKAKLAEETADLNKKIQVAKESGLDPAELRAIRDSKYSTLKGLSKPLDSSTMKASSKKVDFVPSNLTAFSHGKLLEPTDLASKILKSTKEPVVAESKKSKILEPSKSSLKPTSSIKVSEKKPVKTESRLTTLDSASKIHKATLEPKKSAIIQPSVLSKLSNNQQAQKTEKVDLAFLIDGTASMQPWIDITREKVLSIIEEAQAAYSQTSFRLAVVIYRDFDMGSRSMEIQEFTDNIQQIQGFLTNVKARGGRDGPEDVNGGFQRALNDLEWNSSIKILVHIADAPCHGPQFHDMTDYFPQPTEDVDWETIFKKMKSEGIDYKFMKLSTDTDKMTGKFREIWESIPLKSKAHFDIYDKSAGTKDLIRNIVTSVKESIKMSLRTNPVSILKSAEASGIYSKQFQKELLS